MSTLKRIMEKILSIEICSYSSGSPQQPFWLYGPLIEIGCEVNASPSNIRLSKVSGLAPIHARIELYDATRVYIHPLGASPMPIRVAPHPYVEWAKLYPLQKSTRLNMGDIIHLGPLNKGYRFKINTIAPYIWTKDQKITSTTSAEPIVPSEESILPPKEILILLMILLCGLYYVITL